MDSKLIGKLLKKKRKELHLSQSEMSKDVLSYSYYSKVERGIHDINIQDLINILTNHNINVYLFFKELGVISEREEWVACLQKIQKAFYLQKITDLENLQSNISNSTKLGTLKKEELIELIILVKYIIENKVSSLPEKTKKYFKHTFMNYENWDNNSLQIFAWSMVIYRSFELTYLVKRIVKKYSNIEEYKIYTQVLIASIIVNYLVNIYNNTTEKKDMAFIHQCWTFLKRMPYTETLGMYKMMGKCVLALIEDDNETVELIISSWRVCGLDSLIQRLPKKIVNSDNLNINKI